MRVSIVQSTLVWENPDQNRANFTEKMAPLAGQTDLVVLPEMFSTGFSMQAASLAEHMDKKHLFTLAGESEHYTPGKKRLIIEWKGWRICPLVCYDLRFPAWSRNRINRTGTDFQEDFDLLLYVANWPARRAHHWRTLLAARAIENQAFTIGVNMVGTDGNGLEYSGDSTIIDFGGQVICQISGQEDVVTAELSLANQQHYRQQLPFLQDADIFTLH